MQHRVQVRARRPGRRESLLGQDGREGHVSADPAAVPACALQPVRGRTVHEHLSDGRPLPPTRRHRRSQRRLVHRVPQMHGGVPLRSAVHRPQHAHGREVQLLREPDREQARTGVRHRLPHRVPHLRRPGRSDQRSRADRRSASRSCCASRRRARGPKIFYLGADDAAMRPEIAARPLMFREGQVLLRPLGSVEPDAAHPGDPRVDYDTPHKQAWGVDLVLYLLFKGISTGAMFLVARCSGSWGIGRRSWALAAAPLGGLHVGDGRRTGDRPGKAGALLLHPDAAQLVIVADARRVPADWPQHDRFAVGAGVLDGLDRRAALDGARGDGCGVLRHGLHGFPVRAGTCAGFVAGTARRRSI